MPKNYRQFFTEYFADKSKFIVEQDLEGAFEKQTVRAKSKSEKLRIEIIYVADNGKYEHLHHIRFKHPSSVGFAFWQNQQKEGFGKRFCGWSLKQQAELRKLFEERLELGWQEHLFFKNQEHYKSKIILPSKLHPKIIVWRREQVSFAHILLGSLFGVIYRALQKEYSYERRFISTMFFLKN